MGQSTFWHLRDHINLSLGDRVRVGAVCRNWNFVLSQAKHDILGIPDAPWRIISENSPNLQVSFESLSDEKIYRFYLPGGHDMVWFCGSSRRWLLMASGNRSNPNLFLWNPLNGSTRNLPPLSTHPYFAAFQGGVRRGGMCISRLFVRVHVFSHDSAECVVAAMLSKRVCPRIRISFCTPRDDRWTTFGVKEDRTTYVDVRYNGNSGSLWLLIKGGTQMHITLETRGGVCLPSGCNVPISFCFLDRPFQDVDGMLDQIELPRSSLTLKNSRQVYRLVEDTAHKDGGVLIVATSIDRRFCVRDNGGKEVTVHDRTGQVSVIVPFDDNRSKELASIDDQTVFLGSTGTDSIIISNPLVKGIETDCVYLAIDDSCEYRYPVDEHRKYFTTEEQGVYFLNSKKMRNYNSAKVGYYPLIKSGWFEPNFFFKIKTCLFKTLGC